MLRDALAPRRRAKECRRNARHTDAVISANEAMTENGKHRGDEARNPSPRRYRADGRRVFMTSAARQAVKASINAEAIKLSR